MWAQPCKQSKGRRGKRKVEPSQSGDQEVAQNSGLGRGKDQEGQKFAFQRLTIPCPKCREGRASDCGLFAAEKYLQIDPPPQTKMLGIMSEVIILALGWRLAYHVQDPKFDPQHCQKKKSNTGMISPVWCKICYIRPSLVTGELQYLVFQPEQRWT